MRASTAHPTGRRQPAADGGGPGREAGRHTVLSGPWLLPGHDGRLLAFAHVAGAVLRWTESGPGGSHWLGPDVLPLPDVTSLTVVQGRNRYAHLLGRRVRDGGARPAAVDLVYAIQYQAGRPLSEWRTAGNPLAARERSAQTGPPVAAVSSAGTLHVFAPTAEGRVFLRREDAAGRWEPWLDLRTRACPDSPAAVATSTGHVELLVPTAAGALTWYQAGPGAALEPGPGVGVTALPGSVTGLETSPGRVTYYLTDATGGGIVAVRAGDWPVPVGGDPGDGRHAALTTTVDGHPCTVLAHRDTDGRIVLGLCPTEGERYGVWWTGTGKPCVGDPALALDARGRVTVLAATPDGTLEVARQTNAPGLTLGTWTHI
ncbi:hypothetical protein ABZ619_07365 [Streptomyces sp. NPDC007851]|uniref:hypothetical protein n=1 Tax=Streptomyces sp. NPDC007851 TaxID=3155008 RepID=UPI003401D170